MPGMGIFFGSLFSCSFPFFFFFNQHLVRRVFKTVSSLLSQLPSYKAVLNNMQTFGVTLLITWFFFFLFFRNWLCKLTVHQLLKSPLLCTGFLHFDMFSLVGKKRNWNKVAINRTENVLVCCFLVMFSVWRCTFMVNKRITMTEIFPYLCPCHSLVLCRYSFTCLVKLSWEISSRPHCHG